MSLLSFVDPNAGHKHQSDDIVMSAWTFLKDSVRLCALLYPMNEALQSLKVEQ